MGSEGLAKTLCLLFFLAFTWPVTGLADRLSPILGFPGPVLYIFVAWATLVLVLRAMSRRMGD
jgi:hypothetical protein